MSAPEDIKPWERQGVEETEAEYEAFKGYVYQAPPRRLAHSSVKHGSAELSELYNRWRWAERALAYDRHVQRIRDEEREAMVRDDEKERTARQLSMIRGMSDFVDREIAKYIADSKAGTMTGLVKWNDITKCVTQIITLERLIRGESTENVNIEDARLGNLSPDELRELQRLHAKMSAEEEGQGEPH